MSVGAAGASVCSPAPQHRMDNHDRIMFGQTFGASNSSSALRSWQVPPQCSSLSRVRVRHRRNQEPPGHRRTRRPRPGTRAGVLSESALNGKLASLFAETQLPAARQELIRSLLLLWHDHLDASHNLSQGIANADGSFLHAIMHRREPDAWNSKYWWRRVGPHPAFPEIARRVTELPARSGRGGEAELFQRLVSGGKWDAGAFVDACDTARDDSLIKTLREIQLLESEVLLGYFCHD